MPKLDTWRHAGLGTRGLSDTVDTARRELCCRQGHTLTESWDRTSQTNSTHSRQPSQRRPPTRAGTVGSTLGQSRDPHRQGTRVQIQPLATGRIVHHCRRLRRHQRMALGSTPLTTHGHGGCDVRHRHRHPKSSPASTLEESATCTDFVQPSQSTCGAPP